ncbi:unnamed protein product, partial [Prorocentrum cordatum]
GEDEEVAGAGVRSQELREWQHVGSARSRTVAAKVVPSDQLPPPPARWLCRPAATSSDGDPRDERQHQSDHWSSGEDSLHTDYKDSDYKSTDYYLDPSLSLLQTSRI